MSGEKGMAAPLLPFQSLHSFILVTNLAPSVKADDGWMADQLAVNGVSLSRNIESEWRRWLLFCGRHTIQPLVPVPGTRPRKSEA